MFLAHERHGRPPRPCFDGGPGWVLVLLGAGHLPAWRAARDPLAGHAWGLDSEVCRGMDELQHAFRDVMAGVATPVAVVTTLVDGVPHGTTVSAFASLSMNPPMVLVALDRGSRLLAQIRRARRYGVNILGATQSALALTFAGKGPTKFEGLQWQPDQQLPRLPGVPGWLACDLAKFVDGGDHVIALGTVRAAERTSGRPLTYHSRVFGTHNALGALDGLTP